MRLVRIDTCLVVKSPLNDCNTNVLLHNKLTDLYCSLMMESDYIGVRNLFL